MLQCILAQDLETQNICLDRDYFYPFELLKVHRPRCLAWRIDSHETLDPRALYPHLREISSLASWVVSSHKPGCGTSALRHPSLESFWQSDGPQPHTLTIHFARRVKIAYMRFYVNHEQDESYTPTKVQIWAGTGYHDLLLLTELNLVNAKGWLPIDLSNAGGPSEFDPDEDPYDLIGLAGEDLGDSDDDEALLAEIIADGSTIPQDLLHRRRRRRRLRIGRGPSLRCFLVQVRILENHQNGKDTHLRAFQVFAKDHDALGRRGNINLGDNDDPSTPTSDGDTLQTKSTANNTREAALDNFFANGLPHNMGVPEIR